MVAQKGRDLLLKVEDEGSYVTVAGLRTKRLAFNAQVGIVEPTPNPLGPNFGELAGYVAIFEDADGFQMFGALEVIFNRTA